MRVNHAAPVGHHFGYVGIELLKVEIARPVVVHQGKTEETPLNLISIDEHVHDGRELIEIDEAIAGHVKDLKDAVSQEWMLLLAQQSHLISELDLLHQ